MEDVKILVRKIAAAGCAILLTTHQLQIAEILSDRIAIIQKGEILTEAPTQKLIQQFSDTAYKIEVETEINESRIIELETIGMKVEARRIIHVDRSELLYKAFTILQPLPIHTVMREQANLTDIFLQIVKQSNEIHN